MVKSVTVIYIELVRQAQSVTAVCKVSAIDRGIKYLSLTEEMVCDLLRPRPPDKKSPRSELHLHSHSLKEVKSTKRVLAPRICYEQSIFTWQANMPSTQLASSARSFIQSFSASVTGCYGLVQRLFLVLQSDSQKLIFC